MIFSGLFIWTHAAFSGMRLHFRGATRTRTCGRACCARGCRAPGELDATSACSAKMCHLARQEEKWRAALTACRGGAGSSFLISQARAALGQRASCAELGCHVGSALQRGARASARESSGDAANGCVPYSELFRVSTWTLPEAHETSRDY